MVNDIALVPNGDQIRLTRFQEAPGDSFEEYPGWRAEAAIEAAEAGDAILFFIAADPEPLKDQDFEAVTLCVNTDWKPIGPAFNFLATNETNWVAATAPVSGGPPEEQKVKFWDTIFNICRVTSNDPIAAWNAHLSQLVKRAEYLNHLRFTDFKLSAPETKLTIGLPKGHLRECGRMTNRQRIDFTVNIPTEEVFTLPHKGQDKRNCHFDKASEL